MERCKRCGENFDPKTNIALKQKIAADLQQKAIALNDADYCTKCIMLLGDEPWLLHDSEPKVKNKKVHNKSPNNIRLGREIKEIREEKGLTQGEVIDRCKTINDIRTLQRIENAEGKRPPDRRRLLDICLNGLQLADLEINRILAIIGGGPIRSHGTDQITNEVDLRSNIPVVATYAQRFIDWASETSLSMWHGHYSQLTAEEYVIPLIGRLTSMDGHRRKVQALRPLSEFFERKQKILVTGSGGTGKTTALLQLALTQARNLKVNYNAAIPVFVSLFRWTTISTPIELVRSSLAKHGILLDLHALEKRLQAGEFLIVMDGINEIPSTTLRRGAVQELTRFIDLYSANRFVLSTRKEGVGLQGLDLPMVEVQPLEKGALLDFIDAYLPDKSLAAQLLIELKVNIDSEWKRPNSLLNSVRNPLLLWMLLQVYPEDKAIPSNRGNLFERFTKLVLYQWDVGKGSQFKPALKEELLSYVAYAMLDAGEIVRISEYRLSMLINRRMLSLKRASKVTAKSKASQASHDIIKRVFGPIRFSDDDISTVEWDHQLFQDYFASVELRRRCFDDQGQWRGKSTLVAKTAQEGWRRWREPILMMFNLVEGSDQLDIIATLFSIGQTELAFQCLFQLERQSKGLDRYSINAINAFKRVLLDKTRRSFPICDMNLLERICDTLQEKLTQQSRDLGISNFQHRLATAILIADMHLDFSSIVASLLIDWEAQGYPDYFNLDTYDIQIPDPSIYKEVSNIAHYAGTALNAVSIFKQDMRELQVKMFLAIFRDIRVALCVLASRIYLVGLLDKLEDKKAQLIASEILYVWSPMLRLLSLSQLADQMEDSAFYYLEPERYDEIIDHLGRTEISRQKYLGQIEKILRKQLKKESISARVQTVTRNIYAIHRDLGEIELLDGMEGGLLGIEIGVDTREQAYNVLAIISDLWSVVPGTLREGITSYPHSNEKQELSVKALAIKGKIITIRIMVDEEANLGNIESIMLRLTWQKVTLRHIARIIAACNDGLISLEELWEQNQEAKHILCNLDRSVFNHVVFVQTVNGDLKELEAGSTPIDFAYALSDDIGNSCRAAKANGHLIPLTHRLSNGDVVEIIRSSGQKGPSRDWLRPELGYVMTSHAMQKIRRWFDKTQAATESESTMKGREILEKELHRLDICSSHGEIATLCGFKTDDELYAAIGYGDLSTTQIASKLEEQQKTEDTDIDPQPIARSEEFQTLENDQMLFHLAKCCNPVAGDKVVGYVTRTRGLTIHRHDCYNVVHEDEKDRLIPVDWGETGSLYPVQIQVQAWDRVGLMRDITTLIQEAKVNIAAINLTDNNDQTISISFSLEVASLAQLSRLLVETEGIRGIIGVSREGN